MSTSHRSLWLDDWTIISRLTLPSNKIRSILLHILQMYRRWIRRINLFQCLRILLIDLLYLNTFLQLLITQNRDIIHIIVQLLLMIRLIWFWILLFLRIICVLRLDWAPCFTSFWVLSSSVGLGTAVLGCWTKKHSCFMQSCCTSVIKFLRT